MTPDKLESFACQITGLKPANIQEPSSSVKFLGAEGVGHVELSFLSWNTRHTGPPPQQKSVTPSRRLQIWEAESSSFQGAA